MSKTGVTRAAANRRIRQEALREQLSNQGHVQHIVDMLDKISNLDEEMGGAELNRLNVAISAKLKLINKYLPDLKHTEIEGTLDTTPNAADGISDEDKALIRQLRAGMKEERVTH